MADLIKLIIDRFNEIDKIITACDHADIIVISVKYEIGEYEFTDHICNIHFQSEQIEVRKIHDIFFVSYDEFVDIDEFVGMILKDYYIRLRI